jgi:16S rRNA C967 or C1407 C5-methylase (RsmB/RsmF family)
MSSLTRLAHTIIGQHLKAGDTAVDLTAGNGNDTLFLAQCVAPTGRVFAFDIQEQAIETTRSRLALHGLTPCLSLHHTSHAEWPNSIPPDERNGIQAIVMNLGYLPGADESITTKQPSTLLALEHACRLLKPGGIISTLVYTGHPGGLEEAEAVADLLRENAILQAQHVSQFPEQPSLHSPILYIYTRR